MRKYLQGGLFFIVVDGEQIARFKSLKEAIEEGFNIKESNPENEVKIEQNPLYISTKEDL